MGNLFFLIKFAKKREYLEQLMNGELYFNPVRHFRESNEKEIGDQYENAISIVRDEIIDIKCEHPELGVFHFKPVPNQISDIINFNDDPYLSFSTYAITSLLFENNHQHIIDERMEKFGSYALIIQEPVKFIKSVTNKLNEEKVKWTEGLIKYRDMTPKGTYDLNIFEKQNEFRHQAEHRFQFLSNEHAPKIIAINSIKETSYIMPTAEILKRIWQLDK